MSTSPVGTANQSAFDVEEYAQERLRHYETSASRAFWLYHLVQGFVIIGAAAIPVLLQATRIDTVWVATLGASVAAAQGLATLFRLLDTWIAYRSAAELIRRQINLYHGSVGRYAEPATAPSLLVRRIERYARKEHNAWLSAIADLDPDGPGDGPDRADN